MTEARVYIDLKEGVVEIEGPIPFVEQYLTKYASGFTKETAERPVAKRGRPAKAAKPVKKKKVSCDKIIGGMIKTGFFSKSRDFSSIRAEVLNTDGGCSDNRIRRSLKNAIAGAKLSASGAGRGMKYAQIVAV